MTDRLKRWREGDCEITALEEAAALGEASAAAFAGDAALDALRSQVASSRQWVARRAAILRALDAGKHSDAFLAEYRDFEIYDKSFATLAQARAAHLKASALAHFESAREAKNRGDYAGAIRHLQVARWRDPKLAAATEFLEVVRLEAAASRRRSSPTARRRGFRSPAQVQLQRKLLMAEQFLTDRQAGRSGEGDQGGGRRSIPTSRGWRCFRRAWPSRAASWRRRWPSSITTPALRSRRRISTRAKSCARP